MLVFRLIAHTVHQWVPAVTDLLKYVSPLYVSMYLTVEFWDSDLNTSSYLPVFLCYFFVLGSEGSVFRKKKSNSIAVADLHCRELAFQRGSPTLPRHSYSVVSHVCIHSRFLLKKHLCCPV